MVVLLKAFNPAWVIKVGTTGISVGILVGVIAASVAVSVIVASQKTGKMLTERQWELSRSLHR